MRTQSTNFWTPPHIVKRQSVERSLTHHKQGSPNNPRPLNKNNSDQSHLTYDSPHPNNQGQSLSSQQSIISIHSDITSHLTSTSPPNHKTNTKNTLKNRIDETLQPLKNFVESLPFFLRSSSQETALVLLNCADEITRRQDKVDLFEQDPHYIPASARFKYTLTSSKLLTNDQVFLDASAKCTDLIKHTQNEIRKHTLTVVKREVWAAKKELLNQFIHHGLTITRMLLIKDKTSNKYLHFSHDFSDNYISKVAFYNYIFDDSPKLSRYLHTNLETITTHIQTHQTMSQDPYHLDDTTTISSQTTTENIPTTTFTTHQTNNQNNKQTTDTSHPHTSHSTKPPPANLTTNYSTPPKHQLDNSKPTHMPSDNTTHSLEYAQLPPLPTPQDPKTTSITQHNTNVNINVNQASQPTASNNHHNNNSVSITSHTTIQNNPYTTPTPKNRQTNFTPKIINPYKTNLNNTNTTTTNEHNKIITPNNPRNDTQSDNQNTTTTQQRPPNTNTPNKQTITDDNNDEEEQRIGLQDLLDLFDNPNPSRDITLETFANHPQLKTLTNGIKLQLLKILPNLTYLFFEQRQETTQNKAGENAALIWYEKQRTKTATEQVAMALDTQNENGAYPLLSELITDTINKKLNETTPNLTKNIERHLTKNSQGQTNDRTVKPPLQHTGHPPVQQQKNSRKPSQKQTSIITWDDYLANKHKKQQQHKNRTNRKAQQRNAKWNPPNHNKRRK